MYDHFETLMLLSSSHETSVDSSIPEDEGCHFKLVIDCELSTPRHKFDQILLPRQFYQDNFIYKACSVIRVKSTPELTLEHYYSSRLSLLEGFSNLHAFRVLKN